MATLYAGDSLFKYLDVSGSVVRFLSGAKTEDILPMVEDAVDFERIVIHVGTNDLARRSVPRTFEGFLNLLSVVRTRAPSVRIFLSAVLPRAFNEHDGAEKRTEFIDGVNEKAVDLNRKLRELSEVEVVDHPVFGYDRASVRRPLLARDGLHLHPNGLLAMKKDFLAAITADRRRKEDELTPRMVIAPTPAPTLTHDSFPLLTTTTSQTHSPPAQWPVRSAVTAQKPESPVVKHTPQPTARKPEVSARASNPRKTHTPKPASSKHHTARRPTTTVLVGKAVNTRTNKVKAPKPESPVVSNSTSTQKNTVSKPATPVQVRKAGNSTKKVKTPKPESPVVTTSTSTPKYTVRKPVTPVQVGKAGKKNQHKVKTPKPDSPAVTIRTPTPTPHFTARYTVPCANKFDILAGLKPKVTATNTAVAPNKKCQKKAKVIKSTKSTGTESSKLIESTKAAETESCKPIIESAKSAESIKSQSTKSNESTIESAKSAESSKSQSTKSTKSEKSTKSQSTKSTKSQSTKSTESSKIERERMVGGGDADFRIGDTFSTFDEFNEKYQKWQDSTFSAMKKNDSRRSDDEGFPYKYAVFTCKHYGNPRIRGNAIRPQQSYLPTNCPVKIRIQHTKEQL